MLTIEYFTKLFRYLIILCNYKIFAYYSCFRNLSPLCTIIFLLLYSVHLIMCHLEDVVRFKEYKLIWE